MPGKCWRYDGQRRKRKSEKAKVLTTGGWGGVPLGASAASSTPGAGRWGWPPAPQERVVGIPPKAHAEPGLNGGLFPASRPGNWRDVL